MNALKDPSVKLFLLVFLMGSMLLGILQARGSATEAPTAATVEPGKSLFFDDFNYKGTDSADFTNHGWIVRVVDGLPGIPGAIWSKDSIGIVADPDQAGNHLIEMHASSDGTTIHQAQICQQRKFFEGTYASRVRFNDSPIIGRDGDEIVATFYLISQLVFDRDPNYSELDFEYLPNGGWGTDRHFLAVTSWETFSLEPATNETGNKSADYESDSKKISFDGWHMLLLTVADGEINYYVDGHRIAKHDGGYYPEVPMSLNYNLWFINGGQIASKQPREYVEQVDWSFYAANKVLSPSQVRAQVEQMRNDKVSYVNDVPARAPALESPCNF
jgi:hypothetical protein